jgi:hypothetical protein
MVGGYLIDINRPHIQTVANVVLPDSTPTWLDGSTLR